MFPDPVMVLQSERIILPIQLKLGVSINAGADYQWRRTLLLDKIQDPELIGWENTFDGVIPALSKSRNITFVAINMLPLSDGGNTTNAYQCRIATGNDAGQVTASSPVFQANPSRNDLSRWLCSIDASSFLPLNNPPDLFVFLEYLNDKKQPQITTKSLAIKTYGDHVIAAIYPREGPTHGGQLINITVTGVARSDLDWFARFGVTQSSIECVLLNHNSVDETALVQCVTMEKFLPEEVLVELSHNKVDWFGSASLSSVGKYHFVPCGQGQYLPKITGGVCTLCPLGTYKPTPGDFDCVTCDADMYNSEYGALTCTSCPANSVTGGKRGSTSYFDCMCKHDLMVNATHYLNKISTEKILQDTLTRCVACPVGGNCTGLNVTMPDAAQGYWFDPAKGQDYLQFYMCTPRASCPGGSSAICSNGYQGRICGLCTNGWYKSKSVCKQCGDDAWLRFILFVVFVAVIIAAFFSFGSVNLSHVSSISIGMSFWQVISIFSSFDIEWPATVDTSLSAASILNFSTDFMSPQCLFKDMSFVVKWMLTFSVPLLCFLGLVLFYVLTEIRSLLAGAIGKRLFPETKYKYWRSAISASAANAVASCATPPAPSATNGTSAPQQQQPQSSQSQSTISKHARSLGLKIKGVGVWMRNIALWFVRGQLTRKQHKTMLNRCINALLTFLSFCFIFMMTQSSNIFKCTEQTDGSSTLDYSTDITCYRDAMWFVMLPVTLIVWIILGLGSVLLFTYLYATQHRFHADSNFQQRFKFVLRRYKRRFFYWELVVTVRKFLLSVIFVFFKPMMVTVLSIAVVFISLLMHMKAVPYNKKAHNVLEYLVLLSTLVVLFLGLLFFVDRFPEPWMKTFSEVLAVVVIVATTIVVILVILWDIQTRKRKERGNVKTKERQGMREMNKMSIEDRDAILRIMKQVPNCTLRKAMSLLQSSREQQVNFLPSMYVEDVLSDEEDSSRSLRDIMDSLFSVKRFKRRMKFVLRKMKRLRTKANTRFSKTTQRR